MTASLCLAVRSPFEPAGHQPQAIARIARALAAGVRHQTVLGVTGSGKTYVMAKVIEAVNRPALVISHNKTLTAQLFNELREFFPQNAAEYFVSYYDYYQPEAYIPQTGTYIEKDAKINEEIDRLRHRATAAIFSRRDFVIVASVSCIYGLGSPEAYEKMSVHVEMGQRIERDQLLADLVQIQYSRNDLGFGRGHFRVRGDTVEVFPMSADTALRIELSGDTIEAIGEFDPLTGHGLRTLSTVTIFPAQHYVTFPWRREEALAAIDAELKECVAGFRSKEKLVEAQRLYERTMYDLEMLRQVGYCSGIENYSRHLAGRPAGSPPETLIHYLPRDAVIFVDESHVTLPQVQGMCRGDRSRKDSLVEYGWRLPSAFDNRPLTFEEFDALPHQKVYISATPANLERERCGEHVAELIVRPTGLVDPEILLCPVEGQVDDLVARIRQRAAAGERVLVTTLTKSMAEELAEYLASLGIRVRYLHSEITTLERTEIIRELRMGKFDALVGINLLREGLDIPECSLVAVLDADKEGFLRSTTALIQTCGRAARNKNGTVVLYAQTITDAIRDTLAECERRRLIQLEYNREHGIVPETIKKDIPRSIRALVSDQPAVPGGEPAQEVADLMTAQSPVELPFVVARLRELIRKAIEEERYEDAIPLRDKVYTLEQELTRMEGSGAVERRVGELPGRPRAPLSRGQPGPRRARRRR